MKVNKPKSTFAGGIDGADEKEIAKALKASVLPIRFPRLNIRLLPMPHRI